jgi:outer membrane protein OmpA-like peptidoglycan-associated protein
MPSLLAIRRGDVVSTRAVALLATMLAGPLAGCIGLKVGADRGPLADQLKLAEAIGAVRCAGEDLAIAKANFEFSEIELRQGNDARAEAHLTLASAAATRALNSSWPCAPDTDKDGVPDVFDKCPTVPGPKENNGCPWPDTDKDGVVDKDDKCPTVPGPKENHGCPWPDSDGDGIPDNVDKCPTQPEDFDGFEDADGCPEPDNDKDGVPDVVDRCPMDPGPATNQGCPVGDRDGDGIADDVDACPDEPGVPEYKGCPPTDRDNDGIPDFIDKCPDEPGTIEDQGCPKKYSLVVVHKGSIEIRQQVHFATNRYVILRDSYELLNQVAQAIKDNPKMIIEVDGHTDSRADDAFNLKLSQKRAEAVRTYLINIGHVTANRLSAKGWGETCPLGSNLTEAGRAANRRVEFIITNSGEPHPCAAMGR